MTRIFFFVTVVLVANICFAGTIHVPADQPTIQAGIDAAQENDTVLVADGTYTGNGNRDINYGGKNLVVKSENGASETIIDCQGSISDPHRAFDFINGEDSSSVLQGFTIINGYASQHDIYKVAGAILIEESSPTIRDCVFASNNGELRGGAIACFLSFPVISNCTFAYNRATYGAGVFSSMSNPFLQNCIIAFSSFGTAVHGAATLTCCNLYQNNAGDWIGAIANQYGVDGNISVDPEFCNASNGDFGLWWKSPCGSDVNPECGYIGAFDLTCFPQFPYADSLNMGPDALGDTVLTDHPVFYWSYADTAATIQQAYEIEIGTDDDWGNAEIWQSGSVYSADTQVVYFGPALDSDFLYHYRIRVNDGVDWGGWNESVFFPHFEFTINVPSEHATIQDAIDFAFPGDTVLVADGIYTGFRNRDLSFNGKPIVVMSENGPEYTIIDCQGSPSSNHRGFVFDNGEDASSVLDGFTIRNAYTDDFGAGIYCFASSPKVLNCHFIENTSETYGGGLFCRINSHVYIENCRFLSNSARAGAAIGCDYSDLSIIDCYFLNNSGIDFGAISILSSSPHISGCLFAYNTTELDGGAMFSAYSNPSIQNCTFVFNNSENSGSAIFSQHQFSLSNCIFAFNRGSNPIEGYLNLSCCNMFDNQGGDWTGNLEDQLGENGNISADPLFCDVANDNFDISMASDCSPLNSECGLIGAFGIGCDTLLPSALNINFGPHSVGDTVLSQTPDIYWTYYDTLQSHQTAYEIQIGTDNDWTEAEIWESGMVASTEEKANVSGADLQNQSHYYLRIRVSNGIQWGDWARLGLFTHFNSDLLHVPSEFATIGAALDYALKGDTIVIADGIYTGEGNRDLSFQGKSVFLKSVNGPSHTVIDCQAHLSDPHRAFLFTNDEDSGAVIQGIKIRNGFPPTYSGGNLGGAIVCDGSSPIIENCIFENNVSDYFGGAVYSNDAEPTFRNCTFVKNSADEGGSIFATHKSPSIENSIFAFGSGGNAIHGSADLECCNIYGNADGDWVGSIADQIGQYGNISSDPLFCDTAAHDYSLFSLSPCGPYVNDNCALIGALPVACYNNSPLVSDIQYDPSVPENIVLSPEPLISWTFVDTMESGQAAFKIEVGTDNDWSAAEMWQSGVVNSSEAQIQYSGQQLVDTTRYYVRIMVNNGTDWGAWVNSSFITQISNVAEVPAFRPTIQAGIDYVLPGDTVLVADGIYTGEGNRDLDFKGKAITVMSVNGAAHTVIDCQGSQADPHIGFIFNNGEDYTSVLKGFTIKNGYTPSVYEKSRGGGIRIRFASPTIEDCVFENNYGLRSGGAIYLEQAYPTINNCTFVKNRSGDGAVIHSQSSYPVLDECILAFNYDGIAFYGEGLLSCCNIYGNPEGNWTGSIHDQSDINNNFSGDPLFCDFENGNYLVSIASPCAPYQNQTCGLTGALDWGCEETLPLAVGINYGPVAFGDTVLTGQPEIYWSYFDTLSSSQEAYEIQVGTDQDWAVAETWQSGEVSSADTMSIYAGSALENDLTYYLRMRVHSGGDWGSWYYSEFHTHLENVIHVPADQPTIQAGIDAASEGDTVLVADGVYIGQGNRNISFRGRNIVLMSENGPEHTFIGDDPVPSWAFKLNNGEDTTTVIKGFTIRNFSFYGSGTAVNCFRSSATIIDCVFSGNSSSLDGAAIYCRGASTLNLRDCIFKDNIAEGSGGAVHINASSFQIENCLFIRNESNLGGAIYTRDSDGPISASTFVENKCLNGSSMYLGYGNVTVTNCIISFGLGVSPVISNTQLSCCNVYGNENGDYVYDIAGQNGQNGNISYDPLFCDMQNDDYTIMSISPCSPIINQECGLIGAYGIGCEAELPIAMNLSLNPVINDSFVTSPLPEISWFFIDTAGAPQSAYEIELGLDDDWSVAEIWSSGIVNSPDTSIIYSGDSLTHDSHCYIRLRVSNGTEWSEWIQHDFYVRLQNVLTVPTAFATIQEAIDYSLDGDTIVVEDGIYTGEGNRDIDFLGKKIVIKSENGPEHTIIDCQGSSENPYRAFIFQNDEDSSSVLDGFTIKNGVGSYIYNQYTGGGMLISSASPTIKNCLFINNQAAYQGGAIALFDSSPRLINITAVNNSAQYGPAVFAKYCLPIVKNSILAFNNGGPAVYGNAAIECSNIYGNSGGDWTGDLNDDLGVNGNISADPEFCLNTEDDYSINLISPCSPEMNQDCGLIGAIEIGCFPNLPVVKSLDYGPSSIGDTVTTFYPEFNWTYLDTAETDQYAYEIEVGTDTNWSVAETWNSGQVVSGDSQAVYSGPALENLGVYYLRIRLNNGTSWGKWHNSNFLVHAKTLIQVPGDKPTIQSAIDDAFAGDTILVADGVYSGEGNRDIDFRGKSVVVISENGPEFTIIDCQGSQQDPHRGFIFQSDEDAQCVLEGFTIRNGHAGSPVNSKLTGGAILIFSGSPRIRSCVMVNSVSEIAGGAMAIYSGQPEIRNITMAHNDAPVGAAVYSTAYYPFFYNCIITFNSGGVPYGGNGYLFCTNIYGNEGGNWAGDISSLKLQNGNISADPLFCDTDNGNYSIHGVSPCSPLMNSECGLIGARGIGCYDGLPLVQSISYTPALDSIIVLGTEPAFSWEYIDTSETVQQAYEIEIGIDDDWNTAETWSSGQIESDTAYAEYTGTPLVDGQLYYLRLRLFNGSVWGAWFESEFVIRLPKVFYVPDYFSTIQEAIDSAFDGDTVVVSDGIYTGDGNRDIDFLGKRIAVKSENGPRYTAIDCQGSQANPHRGFIFQNGEDSMSVLDGFTIKNGFGGIDYNQPTAGGILIDQSSPLIVNCIFEHNEAGYQGGGIAMFYSNAKLINNTLVKNQAPVGAGIYSNNSNPIIENSILAFNRGGMAFQGSGNFSCSDIFGNDGGNWTGNIAGQLGVNGNFESDPLFCDTLHGYYSPILSSPCTPENNECNVLIGAASPTDMCGPFAVMLVDRSGSMFYTDPLGLSRLERAKIIAHEELDRLLAEDDPEFPMQYRVALMYFNADGIVLAEDFTTDSAALHEAIDNIPGPRHDTPLAAAMCQAACKFPDAFESWNTLLVFTDGLENYSQNEDMCTVCDSCNQYQESGWNNSCQLFGIPVNCTEWQVCIGYSLVSTSYNYAHYFGEALDPFAKGAMDDLPDFEFVRYTALESGGEFYYHSDMKTLCGDANNDGGINVTDAVYIINYVFVNGAAPADMDAADVNCDGGVNVSDAVTLINYIFMQGSEPCDPDGDGSPDC